MERHEQRRRASRAISLADERYEVTAVKRAFGAPWFAVEAVQDDERLWVRALPAPAAAMAMASCLSRARAFLAVAWAIADNPELWADLEREAAEGVPF